ncbi:LEAF RUST 10 DISEASE-RESISTANCE LOCUS RECEPTOR-LIKE PROTEIN KINASE-like 1.1 isoform X2 [Mercurialis annua]|uniref:LEAF RUST 10 DISEASE-RESISTANCE LOCUS RECEPTOR-LIKE PROTEIN KINASE-like 1.1 isoform X2 n=1 Tax=Mercurialis annua TaxID=3986 RepID=UPI0021606AB1|nr:LEAF RUST 10 DISEASE-RESISTANCE LOCUS RECEPTOR-LIKE PROTEIN KINASE-like 1.1 isoform X2 [Mercurialis annua]
MVPVLVLVLFTFSYLPSVYSADTSKYPNSSCPSFFNCGDLGDIRFPFTQPANSTCGLFMVNCSNQKVQLERGGKWYKVDLISEADTIFINDTELQNRLDKQKCDFIDGFPRSRTSFSSFQIFPNITMLKCNRTSNITFSRGLSHYIDCSHSSIYYTPQNRSSPRSHPDNCLTIQLPGHIVGNRNNFSIELTSEFHVRVFVSNDCSSCHFQRGGECQIESNGDFLCANAIVPTGCKLNSQGKLQCANGGKGSQKMGWKKRLALGLGGLAAIFIILLTAIFTCRLKYRSRNYHQTNNSGSSLKSDIGLENINLRIPIFPYSELEEATDNFASEKELGEGGYGTVYYGKLQDGREVAIKRLYEHNYKRVQQFLNEIEILTRLRHRNLVSLYGCAPQRSRELILIYEYIPNGTVADHLHGDRSKSALLTWPNRMRIAIETASALAYLHASDIIHRDVKTDNILLDNNFFVKVADFGLSRLFPNDATHISTAPQGTLGYVDPEYYRCYQLTNKSDVYSFGVVLVELISSMPAVDITRHRNEINLAELAVDKIQRCAFDELIDPCLGYRLDEEVKRMTTSVAELAFLCLQQEKEMRPPMDGILEELKRIENRKYDLENLENEHDHT